MAARSLVVQNTLVSMTAACCQEISKRLDELCGDSGGRVYTGSLGFAIWMTIHWRALRQIYVMTMEFKQPEMIS